MPHVFRALEVDRAAVVVEGDDRHRAFVEIDDAASRMQFMFLRREAEADHQRLVDLLRRVAAAVEGADRARVLDQFFGSAHGASEVFPPVRLRFAPVIVHEGGDERTRVFLRRPWFAPGKRREESRDDAIALGIGLWPFLLALDPDAAPRELVAESFDRVEAPLAEPRVEIARRVAVPPIVLFDIVEDFLIAARAPARVHDERAHRILDLFVARRRIESLDRFERIALERGADALPNDVEQTALAAPRRQKSVLS